MLSANSLKYFDQRKKSKYEQDFKGFNIDNVQSFAINPDDILVGIDKWWYK